MNKKETILKGFDIVAPSWISWDNVPLIMHHMSRLLAKNNRVLFIDPPVAVTTFLFHPGLSGDVITGIKNWYRKPFETEHNLWRWTPPPLFLDIGFNKFSDDLNLRIIRKSLKKAIEHIGFRDFIIWSWHPYFFNGKPEIGEKLLCLDVNDMVASFAPRIKRGGMERIENRLSSEADLLFVTSPALLERFSRLRDDVKFFPSGVDFDAFSKALEDDFPIAPDIAKLPKPVIGYIGVIDDRLDWKLLMEIARARPEWSFSFVGPIKPEADSNIRKIPNFYFHGKKSYDELPGFMKSFDVAIIPFRINDFSEFSFPTKTFEYFASGLPVVSTPIPALKRYEPLLSLAGTPEDFITALELFISETSGNDGLIEKRITLARNTTWEARLEKTTGLLLEKLNAGSHGSDGEATP